MPGGDKTGPMGLGAMSGRGVGYCSGNTVSGNMNSSFGGGFGQGRNRRFDNDFNGRGRGRNQRPFHERLHRRRYFSQSFNATVDTAKIELVTLKDQAQYLKNTLKDIEIRIDQLQKDSNEVKNNKMNTEE